MVSILIGTRVKVATVCVLRTSVLWNGNVERERHVVADDLRTKLLDLLNDSCFGEEIQLAWGDTTDILDVIWPEIESAINEAYRIGRTEGLKGNFTAGTE